MFLGWVDPVQMYMRFGEGRGLDLGQGCQLFSGQMPRELGPAAH